MQEQEKLYADANNELKKKEADYAIATFRLLITIFTNSWRQVQTLLDAFDTPLYYRFFDLLLLSCIIHGIMYYVTVPLYLFTKNGAQNILWGISIAFLTAVFVCLPFGTPFSKLLYIIRLVGVVFLIYDIFKIFDYYSGKKKLSAMKEQYAQSMLNIEYE